MLRPFFADLSIDDLVVAKYNTEQHFYQFKSIDARVKRLAKDIRETELTVHTPFRVAFFVDDYDEETDSIDTFYLIGGRHRLQALLSLREQGEEDFCYSVSAEPVYSVEQLLTLVKADNGSRSMTGAEEAQLTFCSSKSLYGESDLVPNLTELKKVGVYKYQISTKGVCTQDTTFKIWKSTLGTVNKLDKKLGKILVRSLQAQSLFAEIFETELVKMLSTVSGNVSRSYKLYADKLAEILVAECEDFHSRFSKEATVPQSLTKEDHAMFERAVQPTDVTSIKERNLMVNLMDNQPSNGEDGVDEDIFSQF